MFSTNSTGKKGLVVGLIELYLFVKVLEEDWHAVMGGMAIEYGSQTKKCINIEQSMGVEKKRKKSKVGPTYTSSIKHIKVNNG